MYNEKYYIKNNKVYYYKHQEPTPILKSIEVIDGEIRLNHHDNHDKKIPDEIYDKMKNMLIDHYHGIALKVNEFINQLVAGTMIKIHGDIIEIIYDISNEYIHYDFYIIYPYGVGSGYYWFLRLKKDDDRIGRRKLYKSSKGLYFIENGYRSYINSFHKIKKEVIKC